MKRPNHIRTCKIGIPLVAGALLFSAASSNATVLISVGGSNQFREVSTTSSATWNFYWSGDASYSFDSAAFTMKRDNSTIASTGVTMTVWNGYGGSDGIGNTAVATVTLPQSSFTTGLNLESFAFSAQTLAAGAYSVQLTSDAVGSSSSYQVKLGSLKLSQGGVDLSTSLYTTDGNTTGTSVSAVPEPSVVALSGLAVVAFGLRRRRA